MSNPSDAKKNSFLPQATMFKLTPLRLGEYRGLECVACGAGLGWDLYMLASEKFDAECPTCGVKAVDYWADKPHREINDGKEDNEAGDGRAGPT